MVLRRLIFFAALLVYCAGAVSDASLAAPQTPQQVLPAPAVEELNQVLAADAAARAHAGPYRIQSGDELGIREFNIPNLNLDVKVRPDGRISVLLLNDIEVAGRTTEEIGQTLSDLYSKHFRNPKITVMVRNFYNFNVYVGGEVSRPGLVPLAGGLTATSAIFQTGGFKEEEGPRRVMLIRRTAEDGQSILNLDLDDVLVRGKSDIVLQPSDVLYVPRNTINVYVGGEVVEPGLVPLNGKMTALAAILRAHGLKNTARPKSVMLLRNSGQGKPIILRVNLQDVINKGAMDPDLRPYDVVFVPKSVIARMDQFIDQYGRQLLPISVNMGFSYLLGGVGLVP